VLWLFLAGRDVQEIDLIALLFFGGKLRVVGGCIENVTDVGDVSPVGMVCCQNIVSVTKITQ
jgi:hypothetical protein